MVSILESYFTFFSRDDWIRTSRTKRATGLRYIPKLFIEIFMVQIIELQLPKQRIIYLNQAVNKQKAGFLF